VAYLLITQESLVYESASTERGTVISLTCHGMDAAASENQQQLKLFVTYLPILYFYNHVSQSSIPAK